MLNILYLHAHDAGRFVQPFGYDIPTPNLQALAEDGILFRKAFSAAPTCSPSRSALLTGTYPHQNGMHGLATDRWGFTLNDPTQHIAHFLRDNGYQTAVAGVTHLARDPWGHPIDLGWERLINFDGDSANQNHVVADALGFLAEDHDRPFFLAVGFVEPHRYNPGDRYTFSSWYPERQTDLDSRYCAPLPIYPDTPETREETAHYKVGAEIMDRKFGAILDGLKQNHLDENTLVICTTDHGLGFPGMKCTLTDWGTGVFLVMRGPSGFDGGRVIDASVTHMDLFPTICDILGLDAPDYLEGTSMMPLVRGEVDHLHEATFSEQGYHGDYIPLRAVRTDRYKLIRCFDTSKPPSKFAADAGPAHWLWQAHGWDDQPMPEYQLYDLIFDPAERHNLADDPAYAAVFDDMKARLDAWMDATDDPIRHGHLPLPPAWETI